MPREKHVGGFDEFDKLLKKLPVRTEERVLQNATQAAARVARKNIKAAAPVGSGEQSPASKQYKRLSQNIKVRVNRFGKKRGQRQSRVYTGDAFWGVFLEFGTRFVTARPWFRPAFLKSQGAMIKKLAENLGKGIEREAKKLARLK